MLSRTEKSDLGTECRFESPVLGPLLAADHPGCPSGQYLRASLPASHEHGGTWAICVCLVPWKRNVKQLLPQEEPRHPSQNVQTAGSGCSSRSVCCPRRIHAGLGRKGSGQWLTAPWVSTDGGARPPDRRSREKAGILQPQGAKPEGPVFLKS